MTIATADVYKAGTLAAQFTRTASGVEFAYLDNYVATGGQAIASTLPLTPRNRLTPAGAVPPYFAGLLPEGRRLTALRRTIKTSADDELSLLIAVGTDTIGNVQIVPTGKPLSVEPDSVRLESRSNTLRFADLLTNAHISDRPTLAGVQDKASASMITLPVSRRHERYILKLNPPEYPHLVENEHHLLDWSRAARNATVKAELIHDSDGVPGLLVTRFDRVSVNGEPHSLHVEDAAQALDLWPADKYNITFETAAGAIIDLCDAPLIAARGILQQLVFVWLTGNGDLHAKNMSVVTTVHNDTRLAPAYDLPSTLFYGDTTLALTVGGRDTLTAGRYHQLAGELGVRLAAAERILGDILGRTSDLIDSLDSLPYDNKLRERVKRQL